MSAARKLSIYSDAGDRWRLLEGDALALLKKLPSHSMDAVVCDPPYNLSFAGNAWDGAAILEAVGGAGERLSPNEAFARWTQVWASEACRVLRPGGFVVAFGAPRTSHALASGLAAAGLELRDTLMWLYAQGMPKSRLLQAGNLATTLKPAYEPIVLARAPLDGTTPHNLETWGTGALNIDACRVAGRWPAHVVLSHDEGCTQTRCVAGCPAGLLEQQREGLSRMFFCAKATRAEREAGLEQFPARSAQLYTGKAHPPRMRRNQHPTVKPLALMQWLIRLVTPPNGTVLDPFTGSGSTGAAALMEGRRFCGIEKAPDYVDIACARLTHWAHEARGAS